MHYVAPVKFTLSHEHTALMLYKLRNANDRYVRIAQQIRAHARRRQCSLYRMRAAWLGLTVDISAAVALSDTQVSKIPLPILDMSTPSPVEPKVFIRIPPYHMRPAQLPSITTTAPTPMVSTHMSRVDKIYSPIPIRIPLRGPIVHLQGIDWGVPGAPLLRPRELPEMSPETGSFSPMSLDSDSSGPSMPEDRYAVALRIKLPGKRKLLDVDVHDTLSHKHHMKKRWAQTASASRVTPQAGLQPHLYF